MTAFFIPGISDDAPVLEEAYRDLRSRIELEMGILPNARRIVKPWARRGSVDCVTEVGQREPLRGGTVIAILTWALIGRSSSAGSKTSGADKAPARSWGATPTPCWSSTRELGKTIEQLRPRPTTTTTGSRCCEPQRYWWGLGSNARLQSLERELQRGQRRRREARLRTKP